MSLIAYSPFGGMVPKADPLTLPPNASQLAINCRLTAGILEAYNLPWTVFSPATVNVRTIYRYGQATNSDTDYWFTSDKDVNFVKGAIANDTEERTYYTGDGYPKVTKADIATVDQPYPSSSWRLGLPNPGSAIVATVSGSQTTPVTDPVTGVATETKSIPETRFYLYTFVSAMGEESGPSPASNEATVYAGQTVSLMLGGPPSGPYNVTSKRIYRTSVGSNSTDYLFVAEVDVGTGSYDDTTLAENLGEVMPSLLFNQLPDLARGLTGMANGMMAAHTDYDVYFCEPFKPYAWPESYIQTVDYPIVGTASFGNSLVVLTTGMPYLMTGSDPSSVTVDKLAVPYACLSKRSICSALNGVIYAAADGLVCIDNSGARVLTDGLMTRREWQGVNPSSMLCAVWDEKIFIFFKFGEAQGGLILDLANGLTLTDVYATAAYTDPVTGSLFLCVNDRIVKWDAGLAGSFKWWSRKVNISILHNFAYGQVLASSYPQKMIVHADIEDATKATAIVAACPSLVAEGTKVKYTATATDSQPFRLPGGFSARYWEVEMIGSGKVFAAMLADSVGELQRV